MSSSARAQAARLATRAETPRQRTAGNHRQGPLYCPCHGGTLWGDAALARRHRDTHHPAEPVARIAPPAEVSTDPPATYEVAHLPHHPASVARVFDCSVCFAHYEVELPPWAQIRCECGAYLT